jgi:pimeloyl-ACP methyl ester carboxylesterase
MEKIKINMEHKSINSENGTVHYWIKKQKNIAAKCIVFTHGLTADHSLFEKQIPFFETRYTIITWDVPLHGLSNHYNNFSYRQTALELKAILEKEQIEKVVLVGMSMGGYVSQMFADLYPDMVEGFVALDTTPFGLKFYSKFDMYLLRHMETMAKWFPDAMLRNSIAKSASKTEYSYHKMLDMMKPFTKNQIARQMGIAYGDFVRENKDVHFSFPVLILLGDHDKTGKMQQYCKAWTKETGYPLHIIHNAAHFSNGDNAEQVNAEIEAFVCGL